MTDFRRLIPEIAAWNNGAGVDVHTWISALGTYERAIGYSTIFWPEFVEIDDCVFYARNERSGEWRQAYDGDKRKIESLANHTHIDSIHYGDAQGKTPDRLQYLAKVLQDIHICKLKRDFPNRHFRVEICGDDAGPILTFYQVSEHEAEQAAPRVSGSRGTPPADAGAAPQAPNGEP